VLLRLAAAAIAGGRRRSAWAAGAVGVSVALSVSIATMVGSFRTSVTHWAEETLRADLSVRPLSAQPDVPRGHLDPALVERLRERYGADAVDPTYLSSGYFLADGARRERITILGEDLRVRSLRSAAQIVSGGPADVVLRRASTERGVLVNEAFALRFGAGVGSRIALELGEDRVEREVVGIARDYGDSRGVVTLDWSDYLEHVPDSGPRAIGIYLPTTLDADAERAALSALETDFPVSVLSNQQVRGLVLDTFERTFAITSSLQIVAALVAGLAVVSVLFALVTERRSELALIGALGGSRAQVAGVVCTQAGMLGMLGSLGGALAGLVIGVILVVVVNRQSFGWTLELVWPWTFVAWTLAWVVVASVLMSFAPALAAARASVVQTLREN
jgi:putative ABC transport system permease protein